MMKIYLVVVLSLLHASSISSAQEDVQGPSYGILQSRISFPVFSSPKISTSQIAEVSTTLFNNVVSVVRPIQEYMDMAIPLITRINLRQAQQELYKKDRIQALFTRWKDFPLNDGNPKTGSSSQNFAYAIGNQTPSENETLREEAEAIYNLDPSQSFAASSLISRFFVTETFSFLTPTKTLTITKLTPSDFASTGDILLRQEILSNHLMQFYALNTQLLDELTATSTFTTNPSLETTTQTTSFTVTDSGAVVTWSYLDFVSKALSGSTPTDSPVADVTKTCPVGASTTFAVGPSATCGAGMMSLNVISVFVVALITCLLNI